MEPQIIDYYNDEPSNVYVIDKMNKELDEIQKENDELRKKNDELRKKIHSIENKYPKIIFNSKQEFEEKHQNMYNKIKERLLYYFDVFEYNFMEDNGITPRQFANMHICIGIELEKITGDKDFAYVQSYKIMKPILCMYAGREIPHWLTIYNSLTKEQLFDIFYYQIVNHIQEYTSQKYALFKCSKCGKIDDYVNEENWCNNCFNEQLLE